MIQLKPYRQQPSYCGPASLKIVLEYYGVHASEKNLAKRCHTTKARGTSHAQLVAGAQSLGLVVKTTEGSTLRQLRCLVGQEIPVIIGWYSTDDDHYSVVYKLTRRQVWMMDPELSSGLRRMSVKNFLTLWHDYDSSEKRQIKRWMMWVKK